MLKSLLERLVVSDLIVIPNNLIVFCDVDDTLLMTNNIKYWEPNPGCIKIKHPLNGEYEYPVPHKEHIKLLKNYKKQGYFIVVWSAQGYEWASEAVNALRLNDTVNLCMSKCLKYVDDLKANDVLGQRVYIPFEQVNKIIEPSAPNESN